MSKTKIMLMFVLVTIFMASFLVQAEKASAQVHFGGFVTASFFCPCSGNFLLTISGPIGGQFIFQPGTPQFSHHQLPRANVWALGLYNPGGVCMVPATHGCNPAGAPIGTISPIVGTSL